MKVTVDVHYGTELGIVRGAFRGRISDGDFLLWIFPGTKRISPY